MLTGLDAVKDVEKAMAAGANSYLLKPIERNRLKVKIESFIKLTPIDEQKKV
jgi:response regulator of citrate/malate metabolism